VASAALRTAELINKQKKKKFKTYQLVLGNVIDGKLQEEAGEVDSTKRCWE